MNDSILIYDKSITGHNLEYIHHLYLGAMEMPNITFIFAIPKAFLEMKAKFVWPDAQNIHFHLLTESDCRSSGGPKQMLHDTRLLRQLISHHHIGRVLFINWISLFVILLLPLKVKVSGISYNIYLYNWSHQSFFSKVKSIFKTIQYVWYPQVSRVFVLNDSSAVAYLNRLYHTSKFVCLPDPINLPHFEARNIRQELGISREKKMFLLFGSLSERKGTLCVLRSLLLLNQEENAKYHFVLAGSVDKRISEDFYDLFNKASRQSCISLFDQFCSYEFIADLCYSCDVILMPYLQTSNSSGVVGYAAFYHKPVIAPGTGLIGKIVRNYSLGIRLPSITPEVLREAYRAGIKMGPKSSLYIHTNDISTFTKIILSS